VISALGLVRLGPVRLGPVRLGPVRLLRLKTELGPHTNRPTHFPRLALQVLHSKMRQMHITSAT
jgi:hypothetical protein